MIKRTFIVHYEQWLEQDADALGWSEHKEISVRLTSDALTSGWLLQFSNTPLDYLVLAVISLHARLMNAKDLEWLSKFGLATDADLGRMFSYATDMTIAAELGIHRTTVAACAERLAENNNLVIRSMDGEQHNQLRQSGNFKGRKIYIIAGGVALKKRVTDLESHRVGSTDTVESYRVSPTDTVTPQDQPTVSVQPTHRVSPTDTNINTLVVVADETEQIFDFRDEVVFGHFAAKKGNPYKPTGNDRKALKRLREAGYSLQQITAAIDEAFDRGDNPTTFAYCARIVEDSTPARHETPAMPASPASPATPDTPASPADLPEEIKTLANMIAPHLPERDPLAGQALPNVARRLKAMADSCAEAADQHGATGADWLRDALLRSIGKDDPLAYAAAVLRAWAEHGPAADLRPTRDGYHPPRRASTAAPANPDGANGDSDPYRVVDPPLLPLPEK